MTMEGYGFLFEKILKYPKMDTTYLSLFILLFII